MPDRPLTPSGARNSSRCRLSIYVRATARAVALAVTLFAAAGANGQERSAHANYILRCAGCHTLDGSGVADAGIPDFRNLVGAFTADEAGRTYFMHVPGVIGASLTDQEIAGLLNYVVDTWAGESRPPFFINFTANEVARLRAVEIGDVVTYRRSLVEDLTAKGIATADYPWP